MPGQAARGKLHCCYPGQCYLLLPKLPATVLPHCCGTIPGPLHGNTPRSALGQAQQAALDGPHCCFHISCAQLGPCSLAQGLCSPGTWLRDSQGGWWQQQHGVGGTASAWPPAPGSCQTSAAGGSWLPPGSAGKTTLQEGSWEGQPILHGCFVKWGTPSLQGGAAQSCWSP